MSYNRDVNSKTTEERARLKAHQDSCEIEGTGCWWYGGDDTNVYETPPQTVPDNWEP